MSMATGSAPISISATVDIGFGRGRLAPAPADSLRRIDAMIGRPTDVNDAWRSPEQADRNRAAWIAYQNGTGPAAPYALDRWGSIHCRGYAVDSDDWYIPDVAALLRRAGWRQTALYPIGDSRREPWHGEYDEALDEFLGQPAAGGSTYLNLEDDMPTMNEFLNTPAYTGGPTISQFFKAVDQGGVAAQVWGRLVDRGFDADGNRVLIPAIQELADAKTLAMQILGKPVADVTVDVDEAAIAASLAPLITAHVGSLSDDDVRRLSAATADELAKRLSNA